MERSKLKSIRDFKSDGQTSKITHQIFDKESEKRFKKQIIVKASLLIILTNTLNYLLFAKIEKKDKDPNLPKSSVFMNIELTNFANLNTEITPVTIIDQSDNILAKKAVILEKIGPSELFPNSSKYKVILSHEDMKRIIAHKNKELYSYPIFKATTHRKISKKGGPIEVTF